MRGKNLLLIGFVVLLFLTGCTNKKSLSTDEVKKIVKSKGFEVVDAKNKYESYDYIENALDLGNSNFYIQFIVVSDNEKAITLFNNNKELIDGNRNGDYTNKSTSGKNYETYELISDGYYMYVSRIDNTIVYSDEKIEYKKEIQDIIKALKY